MSEANIEEVTVILHEQLIAEVVENAVLDCE